MSKRYIGAIVVAFFSAALLIPVAAQAARPQVSDPHVWLRIDANGRVSVQARIRVDDPDGIDTVSVTVERPGVFGPFPLRINSVVNTNDSDTGVGFFEIFRANLIPAALRAGDYVIRVRDGTHEVTATHTLPVGLTPLPTVGAVTIDISTGLLTPTVSVPAVAGAQGYRLRIRNQTDLTQQLFDGVSGPGLSPTPVFALPSGVLEPGDVYTLRVEAFEGTIGFESDIRTNGPFNVAYDTASGAVGRNPNAFSLSLTTDEGSSVSATLRGNTNPSGDPITFLIPIGTSHGDITNFNPNTGDFTYTPDPGFAGQDSFIFQTNEGLFLSNSRVVPITVNPLTLEGLGSVVDGLVLGEGLKNSLVSKLEAAQRSLDKGKTKAANNQINAFINEVEALVEGGRLDAETAGDLIETVEAIIAGL